MAVAAAVLAVTPAIVGHLAVHQYAARQMAADFSEVSSIKPRSFEIPVAWGGWQRPGNANHKDWPDENKARPYCGDICQKLLYSSSADSIYVTIAEDVTRDSKKRVVAIERSWRFRAERREFCPEILSNPIADVKNRIANGECLIEERVYDIPADVIFRESYQPKPAPPPWRYVKPRSLAAVWRDLQSWFHSDAVQRFALWEVTERVKILEVYEKIESTRKTSERRTQIFALVPPLPFYLGINNFGFTRFFPKVSTSPVEFKRIDPTEVLNRRYGINLECLSCVLPSKRDDHHLSPPN